MKIPFLKAEIPIGIVLACCYWIFWGIDKFLWYFSSLVNYWGTPEVKDLFLECSVGMIVGLVLITTGIFIFLKKNWARKIAIIQLFISVYLSLRTTLLEHLLFGPKTPSPIKFFDRLIFDYLPFQNPFDDSFLVEKIIGIVMWWIGLFLAALIIQYLFILITIILFLYLNNKRIKEYFKQSAEKVS